MWDWESILRPLRPKRADRDIQKQFSMVFEVRDAGSVFVKSKRAVSAKVAWGPWFQMLPHPLSDCDELPTLDHAPPVAAPKVWKKLDKVSTLPPTLKTLPPNPNQPKPANPYHTGY